MRCSPLFITFSIASLLFQPAGSTYAQTTSPAIGLVKGRVTGPVGEALAGATVIASAIERSAASRSVSTRSDGSYQVSLASGRYELRVLLIGYVATVDSINVTTNGTTVVDFDAQRVRTNLERVAVVGTRGEQRTAISAPVPIDVISAADIQQSGRTETAQMLQSVAPSINFPRATIADGTDHIRPVTLRGLSPDQALILVNGKRRHTSALVNLNGFIGRGSQAVDLNAIPASMIDHIEILRDGAAAQYGSDAIAGVVNIILKSQAVGNFSIETGQNITTYNRDATPAVAFPGQLAEQSVHDGQVVTSSLNYGWTPGERSYLQIGGEIRDRAGTNRSLPDTRQQYFTGDPRNLRAPIINHWQGDSYNHDTQLFLNSSHTFDNDVELYAFGGYGHRRGASAGFWRRPLDDRTVRSLYPDGFLPFIKSEIDDGSFSVGAKGNALGWKWDLGSVYGRNAFGFTIDNSANVSLGNASPTSFKAGKLASAQSTTTLDLFRVIRTPWSAPLRLALGAEFRADRYSITQGDSASWRDGGVRVLDTNGVATTRFAALGSQVFPGFRPGDAGAHSRTNGAAYVDIENEITSKLLVDVAGRAEHYSDFGSTTTGKIAARYKLAERFVLRGAASSGFRAPSLGQEFFSSTATNFIAGVPFDVRTFPVNTAEARLLGARDLKPERSLNLSAGIAVEPVTGLAL
ncbi:MAG: TonB-dependent receptor, partial [Gemmatimonadaceae bacterium]